LVGFPLVHAGPGGVVGFPFPPGIASRAVVRVGDSTPRPFSWRRLMAHAPEGDTVCGVLGVEEVRVRQPGALGARRHKPAAGELFPFPARWALSVAGARRCVPLARCALPGAMPAPRVLRCCAPAVLRPCLRGRGRVGRGSCKGVGGGGSVALLFARFEKEEQSWVGDCCAESWRRCRGGSPRSFRLPTQVTRGGRAARTADFHVRHRNTEMRGMT